MDNGYIGPKDAARLLHVSENTVSRWAKEGFIPEVLVTLGGHRRFKRTVIEALAREQEGR